MSEKIQLDIHMKKCIMTVFFNTQYLILWFAKLWNVVFKL